MRIPVVDLVLVGVLLVLGEIAAAPDAVSMAFVPVLTLPLLLRSTAPYLAFGATLAAILTFAAVAPDSSVATIPLVLAYAGYVLGAGTDPPGLWIVAGAAALVMGAFTLAEDPSGADLLPTLLLPGAPLLLGHALRRRGATAERREREAVVEERQRIARELHDVVAHSISVVVLQTQAVRRRLGPEHVREAEDLRAVEGAAREAMSEMRRLFGVLRADGEAASLAPQPGLGELPELLEASRRAGLQVELEEAGEPRPLAPGLDLTAYRIVQEALTNARRHAGARRVLVRLERRPAGLEVLVRDDGSGPTGGAPGHGLIGMRERVALYGGTLEAGAADGGGFRVRAWLPAEGAA